MEQSFSLKKPSLLTLFFMASILAVGLFHEWVACLASVVLIIILLLQVYRTGVFRFRIDLPAIMIAVIVLGYASSIIWAVDRGMAFIGFLKSLPLLLFLLCLFQSPKAGKEILDFLPYFAALTVFLTSLLAQIPALSSFFLVNGRLAGTLQYPNSFAAFSLAAELLLLCKQNKRIWDYLTIAVLLFGILYTGSRTVALLAVPSNLVMLIFLLRRQKRAVFVLLAVFLFALVTACVLYLLNVGPVRRLLSLDFWNQSTFVGRFLYFHDALPMLFKHPFGLGYTGYFYQQGLYQTGLYHVRYIHNDFLQLMLDIGWIPGLLTMAAVLFPLFRKKTDLPTRVILAALFLHFLFDFDLSFPVVFFLLLCLIEQDDGKEREYATAKIPLTVAGGATALLSLYFSVALALALFEKCEAAAAMYPANTDNNIVLLRQTETVEEMNDLAQRILSQNPYVALAYSAKARCAYTEGDFTKVIEYKRKVFELAPLDREEYLDYFEMLMNGVFLYDEINDEYSADVCRKEIVNARQLYLANVAGMSDLGKRIVDQPDPSFPEELEQYIDTLN